MNPRFGRLARALLLAAGIMTAMALPALTGTPLLPSSSAPANHVALAAPAMNNDNSGHNNDLGDDNSAERILEGQVLEIHGDESPPSVLVGQVGGNVWAHIYNNQLHNSGVNVGDYVQMHGEYGDHGIFDAYQIDVIDRFDDNGNGNDNN
ncbi:MAG: hypothetical protein U0893_09645 [Chloroflexota bacterium]